MDISLRELEDSDLPIFWQQLTDPELQQMAAVTRKYHYDRGHFDQHWAKVRDDPSVILRSVLADGAVAGHAAVFGPPSEWEVTYVIGRAHWGQGIATAALAELIKLEPARPLHADAAADNAGSIRVLEKCGFVITGKSRCFAQARDEEIDLVHLTLR
ncbi:RimJ/RimL family protein N-acetyltransferase [Streptomyces sp. Ag109_O5-1]|uniref:GNAT family N-acetyltransferase n=1 Tax=Streptomyces sp. Ag109_O5-1 TaxID=1938851 RepID=UPI000F5155F6|nr:GNAT family N-acetyltransferase [Streptomyces sp. Ag109_O5-1]RPE43567.1 RimJ/RimL family protein N-acetyltransferase [Streptomyces sp. Ag109_O5-1]